MIRLYQTRLENDLPLVDEKRKDLAWGNGIWDLSENRSHFRSHYPLLTAQSIWDNAADHFYQDGGIGWVIPSSYPISEAATIQNGDVIFINQVWVNWINDVAPHVGATANVTVVLFDGDIAFCSGPQQDTLRNLDFVSRIFAPNACPHLFFNPSLTYFNSGKNLEVVEKLRKADVPILEEITAFNPEGKVDNVILRDPGGFGFFVFND